jgi:hypothetical protein
VSATGRGRAREPEDYYTSPSWTVRRLLEAWQPPMEGNLVEPSAGNGAVIRAFADSGISPGRWFACEVREEEALTLSALCRSRICNFLRDPFLDMVGGRGVSAVIGNPPYTYAFEFVQRARELFVDADVCFLLRLAFAASEDRNGFMRENPPDVYLLPNRPSFTGEGTDSADYAWMIWPTGPSRTAGSFRVLNTTPLSERQRDRGHQVLIEERQAELFG